MNKLVIATRGSKLALWQAHHITDRLKARHPGLEVELEIIKTTGDKILDVPLAKVGGKGLFVKEIEDALLDGRAHLAVHSMKDVPVAQPEGLILGVVPEREQPVDALLSVEFTGLDDLPEGARVGTSSLRRQAQLLRLRPDLDIATLRGNLDTRVRKLLDGEFAAIVVAKAGLSRLGITVPHEQLLVPPLFYPAVGQGALGIEYRKDDADTAGMLAFLDHRPTHVCVAAERGFLTGLDGGCQVPIAAQALLDEANDVVHLAGLVCDPEGREYILREASGPADQAFVLGLDLAARVLAAGGSEILAALYEQTPSALGTSGDLQH
jgi:hydroxymethylbilane synthase